jgi:hypothetical protein
MSNNNSLIDGSGYFYDASENAGTVAVAEFYDSATNTGEITDNAVFNDSAANHGNVAVAVFDGASQNTGMVDNAVFLGSAVNSGYVTVSATFLGGSTNAGTVAAATFQDTASNAGGTVTGNAIFQGTSTNSGGYVSGDATFAPGATNNGTVYGTVTNEGSNPSAGTVLSASVVNYIDINGNQYANGTYDVIADGNGGSSNGNYTYVAEFSDIGSDQTYRYVSNGNGTWNSVYINGYVISSVTNYITIDGSQYQNGTVDTVADGNGGTNDTTNYLANGVIIANNITYTERNVASYMGFDFANGTVDYVSDGIGGYTESDRDYPEAGTALGTYGGYAYVANGTGGWNTYLEAGTIISSNNVNYININGYQYQNGTYNVLADGNGGSYNSYTYAMHGDVFTTGVNAGTIYTPAGAYNYDINYLSDGMGGYTEAHLYPATDTYLNEDESYTYTSNAAGGYNSVPKE